MPSKKYDIILETLNRVAKDITDRPNNYMSFLITAANNHKYRFEEQLLILDKDTSSLTVLKPTDFGAMVREAVTLYRKAQFGDSEELWNEILKQSGNYEYAYVGLGKIYETNKSYHKAMEYYCLGDSVENYSSAMKKYRSELLKDSFGVIMTVILIIGIQSIMPISSEGIS